MSKKRWVNSARFRYIKKHNNYDLTIGNIYPGYIYDSKWIRVMEDNNGNTVLYRRECFDICDDGMVRENLEGRKRSRKVVQLQYWNDEKWIDVGEPWSNEIIAWISLGGDDLNYRTIDVKTGKVLTDKRI